MENAYQLLGLEQGPAATEAEIKKAYRKLALVKHPDKNPDNPRAADEFAELQKAYDVLLDKEARAALDALVKAKAARAERTAGHDEKRRRMMADLERREKGWQSARTQEESARAKLQAEMERLRRQAAERAAKKAAEQRAAAAAAQAASAVEQGAAEPAAGSQQAAGAASAQQPDVLSEDMQERLARTLKVSWSRKDGEYGAVQLRAIFAAHGPVEDVVLREGKKRKGSALVVMADAAGAAAAAGAVNGSLANPLLVVPFNKAAAGAAADAGEEAGAAAASGGRAGSGIDAQATRLPPAVPKPAFAAGAVPAGGLGSRPAAPLFAAGARSGSGAAAPQQPTAPLFPGAGAPSSFGTQPAFAASGAGQAPARPAFAAAGGSGGLAAGGAAASFPAAFSSFGGLPGAGSSGVHALNGGLEDTTLARMRQAEERRRLNEELEREQQQEAAG